MRICFLTGQLSNGGAERVVSVIAAELAECGHDVCLYIFARCKNEYKVSSKVRIESMCDSWQEYEKLGIYSRLLKIRKYLMKVCPEIAVGFMQAGYAMYVASFGMNIKRVASVRVAPEKMEEYSFGLRKKLESKWFSRADAVVIQCEGQRAYGEKKKWKSLVVIGNPLSEEAENIPKHVHREVCRNIVMAGRLEEQKNYEMAVKVITRINKKGNNLTLHIYGLGSKEKELRELVKGYGAEDSIFFHGWADNVVKEYEKYDVFLMTSNFEGLPNSLMEAMANGMICISTDCPTGPGDLIKDRESGFLVPINDDVFLERTLETVCSMTRAEREKLSDKARNKVLNKYRKDKIAKQWEMLFAQLMN